jgi:hypothetical protein
LKEAFVHSAAIVLDEAADPRAPGGAVTLALCGAWDHDDDCRWPHHTAANWQDTSGEVRVVFVAEAEQEPTVRQLIEQGLSSGTCTGPDGVASRWKALSSRREEPTVEELELAARLGADAL